MIVPLSLAATLALGATADPCAPVEPAGSPDPASAAAYRAVGDAERAARSPDTAAVAYRAAASRDPGDAASRAALASLCAERHGTSFREGLRRMQGGDRRGAIALFEEARRGPDASGATLLEGICLYEEGDDEAAAPLLRAAESDPAQRESAQFFLGLVALRAGRADEAEALLGKSTADPSLAPFARDLVRSARRSGRLVLSWMAESGWDSNVDLAPDASGPTAATGDGVGIMTGVVDLRPLGESGPFIRGLANWREEARYNALDMRSLGGTAGWQGGRGGRFLLAQYGYDRRDLSGAPYLSAHHLFGAFRSRLASDASVGASWLTRFEAFAPVDFAGYSGTRHVGEADLTWSPGSVTTLVLAWHAGRDTARDPTLSWWENGPRAALRLDLSRGVRLGLDGAVAWRRYDAADPALGQRRSDVIIDGSALFELDLGDRWTLRASGVLRRELSTIPEFTYTKLVPMVGIGYTVGLL